MLLIGCGELGSRHLQAVASLPQVGEIEVVDPRPEALALGAERLAELAVRQPSRRVRWLTSLEDATPQGALCIMATRAQGRCQLVRDVLEQLGYAAFLLEKVVAQSIREAEELLEFSRAQALSIWVNCKMRAYPFHQRVKRLLDPAEPIVMTVVGGNHGLATNGIHLADLFAFYDGSDRIERAGSRIDPMVHRTKRGLFDLSGALYGYTEKGSAFMLSCAADHQAPECIALTTRRYRCVVDHVQRWAAGWAWRPVPSEGNLLVSEMTKQFARDILLSEVCALPTLEQSLVSHRFILGELQPHFSRLLERELELCPVT